VTVKLNLESKERSAKPLTPDTFKETGSTFRGISIVWMVSYGAVTETTEIWENVTSKKISVSSGSVLHAMC